jgi:hypothetical protein
MFKRLQISEAKNYLFKKKALIVFGARQVGKSTFVELLLNEITEEVLYLNGDNFDTRDALSKPNVSLLKNIIGAHKIIFIDEAQRIPNIGILIKIIVDQIKGVQIIATGSSAFDLANHLNEPLTGRKYEIQLHPFSYNELVNHLGFLEEQRNLEQRLIFGSYPEIVIDPTNAKKHLNLITNSYLYKDLFELDQLKKTTPLQKLVKALALQIGSEVNANELSQLIGVSNKTVEKYLMLLENAFVIFSLPSLSKNVRNELKKSRKVYFYDNGVINSVIGNFNPLQNRNDVGALWENYLISERRKWLAINEKEVECYFWRTTQQQEIDYIEVDSNSINAFEFKWNNKGKNYFPKTFTRAYPEATTQFLDKENYHEFLS